MAEPRPFLYVETKEDTAERLAEIAGKPTKNFLYAPEFNAVVGRILTLWELIKNTTTDLNVLLTAENSINLGEIETTMLVALNSELRLYKSPFFVKFKSEDIDYIYSYVGETGSFGAGGTALVDEQFYLIWQSDDPTITIPPKELRMKLTQVDEEDPTYTISKNDGVFVEVFRAFSGAYIISINGYPNHEKVHVFLGASEYSNVNQRILFEAQDTGASISIVITTQSFSGGVWTHADNVLLKTSLHVIIDQ